MEIADNLLRYLLRNAYFINGTAYAGKSTAVKALAEKHGGICCGENYHDALMAAIDPESQANLSYFSTMGSWREFVTRTPEAYAAWSEGCSREAAELEVIQLLRLAEEGKPLFVDTNIPLDLLRRIAQPSHVALMLCPQSLSVERFFQREDPEKQFLLEQLRQTPDPEAAIANFKACLAAINSPENYRAFAESGFFVWVRQENTTPEETLAALEAHFGLTPGE